MKNIITIEGTGRWGVLFNANNQPISWKEIIGFEDGMVIFESFGQYPKRLVLVVDSAKDAQEGFEAWSSLSDKSLRTVCEGF